MKHKNNITIGGDTLNSLKKIREVAKMTQAELAEKIGVSRQSIVRYENGNCEPRASELSKMAEVLNCSVDELLRDDANPTAPLSEQRQGEVETA